MRRPAMRAIRLTQTWEPSRAPYAIAAATTTTSAIVETSSAQSSDLFRT